MNTRITEETKKHFNLYFNMFNLAKKMSEPTEQKIFTILRGKRTMEKEQYYQALSKITDILNSSKTEQEVIRKLDETFPK